MTIATLNNKIVRIEKDIANLSAKLYQQDKKETNLNKRINQIERSITKSTSQSIERSRRAEIQRKREEISRIKSEKARLEKLRADATATLSKYKQDLSRETEREQKKLANAEKKRQKEQLDFQRKLQREIDLSRSNSILFEDNHFSVRTPLIIDSPPDNTKEYDVFISHASEDKEDFVRPLAEGLKAGGLVVWYDEFILEVGDSIHEKINQALAHSKYVIVVLSLAFFRKKWTQYEFRGTIIREVYGSSQILPIWHGVSQEEVMKYNVPITDKFALNSSFDNIEEIIGKLIKKISN
jgi:hypothetical protein